MPLPAHSFEYYYNAIVWKVTPKELLDDAIQQSAEVARIFNAMQEASSLGFSARNKVGTLFQYKWQLLILGGGIFDIESQHIDFLKQQDNMGKTPVHYFALSGNLNALMWIKVNHPDLLKEKDQNGRTIAHLAAFSGDYLLEWLKNNCPELLEEKDNFGITIAHLAAKSGLDEALFWIQTNYPQLLKDKGNIGQNIAHIAVSISKCPEALTWIKENHPELLIEKTNSGMTIAHFAANSGHIDILAWIQTNCLQLLIEKTNGGTTIAHVAAQSGHTDVLAWIKTNGYTITYGAIMSGHLGIWDCIRKSCVELIEDTNGAGCTIAHFAAGFGQTVTLTWIQTYYPNLLTMRIGIDGCTIAHCAAANGHIKALDWIQMHNPGLLTERNNRDQTVAHYAAISKDPEAIIWMQKTCPDLLMEKDINLHTIAHIAAEQGRIAIINYLLQEQPAILKTLWVPDKNGRTPHQLASKDMTTKPNQLRDNALLAATDRQSKGQPQPNDAALLLAFQDEWRELLLKQEVYNLHDLINNVLNFPQALQHDIIRLKPIIDLMAFSFADGVITREKLQELLSQTLSAIPSHRPVFFIDPRPIIIQQLQKFLKKLGLTALTEKQILCLQLIVQDYEQGLLGNRSLEIDLLVKKLLTSTALANLRPKVEITSGLGIRVEDFPEYLSILSTRITSHPLNNDVATTMREVILPGIAVIIHNEDAIVTHVTTHFGELYYLNEKLPLHTDHTPIADANAYRQTLRRLLINLFGAIEIAHSKGRMGEFCEKLSSGYCLEGRIKSAFTWVASLTEMVSFDDLMHRYIHQEYVPYTEVMFDVSVEAITSDPTVCDFIMTRHKGMTCNVNAIYAPTGEVTKLGISKYLTEVLGYTLPAGLSLADL